MRFESVYGLEDELFYLSKDQKIVCKKPTSVDISIGKEKTEERYWFSDGNYSGEFIPSNKVFSNKADLIKSLE